MKIDGEPMDAKRVFAVSPVIPVIVIEDARDALPLAEAILAGGIRIMEITLRTTASLTAITSIRQHTDRLLVGAGTVTGVEHLRQCQEAGAQFAFSPGLTPALLAAGRQETIPFIPGASTLSELMEGVAQEYTHFKFFPAQAAGGIPMLEAISGPLAQLRFCATGGINRHNFLEYLARPNVDCVGGSWIVPNALINAKNWSGITELCQQALACVEANIKDC